MVKRLLVLPLVLLLFLQTVRAAETVRSKDKRIEIALPEGWEATVLPIKIGKIQAKREDPNAFCAVISEAKEDFKYEHLQEYADAVLKLEEKKSALENRSLGEAKEISLHGKTALQYELSGTFKSEVNVRYLKTFVETPTRWNQILCWSTRSNWEDAQEDFQKIIEGFKENSREEKVKEEKTEAQDK